MLYPIIFHLQETLSDLYKERHSLQYNMHSFTKSFQYADGPKMLP